jgi:hypothetical protein
MDGAPLLDAIEEEYVKTHPPRGTRAKERELVVASAGYSKDDESTIAERLRNLGYIE